MTTPKFKKGDVVRRIRGEDDWGVQLDGEYIVENCVGGTTHIQGLSTDFFTEYFELVEPKECWIEYDNQGKPCVMPKEELPSFVRVIPATAEKRLIELHWDSGHFLQIIPSGICVIVSSAAHTKPPVINKKQLHDLGQHLIDVAKYMEE